MCNCKDNDNSHLDTKGFEGSVYDFDANEEEVVEASIHHVVVEFDAKRDLYKATADFDKPHGDVSVRIKVFGESFEDALWEFGNGLIKLMEPYRE